MKGSFRAQQTVCCFLPGPEADSTSSRQQQLQQALPLGIEMKFSSVTCTRVPKAARGLCGEKRPEAWAVTSNPGPVDMTFTQSLEVTSNPGLAVANREEQGSLVPSSTAFDCRAVCGSLEWCSSVLDIGSIVQLKTYFVRTEAPGSPSLRWDPQGPSADDTRLLRSRGNHLCALCQE